MIVSGLAHRCSFIRFRGGLGALYASGIGIQSLDLLGVGNSEVLVLGL